MNNSIGSWKRRTKETEVYKGENKGKKEDQRHEEKRESLKF